MKKEESVPIEEGQEIKYTQYGNDTHVNLAHNLGLVDGRKARLEVKSGRGLVVRIAMLFDIPGRRV